MRPHDRRVAATLAAHGQVLRATATTSRRGPALACERRARRTARCCARRSHERDDRRPAARPPRPGAVAPGARDDAVVAVDDEVRQAADRRGHDRVVRRHRLDAGQRRAFGEHRRHQHDVARCVAPRHFVHRRAATSARDPDAVRRKRARCASSSSGPVPQRCRSSAGGAATAVERLDQRRGIRARGTAVAETGTSDAVRRSVSAWRGSARGRRSSECSASARPPRRRSSAPSCRNWCRPHTHSATRAHCVDHAPRRARDRACSRRLFG